MAANILIVRVTRSVLADVVVGGLLGMMASSVSQLQMLCKVCEGHRKSGR